VQGTLDGVPCLVSCAVDWYAETTVSLDRGRDWKLPAKTPKAAAALRLALAARDAPPTGGALSLSNPLPRSRGYASSTADVAGTIYAVGEALGQPFSTADAARLAVSVEPSDSTIFGELTLFAHRDASFHRPLAALPPLAVVVLDAGGAVDTLAFNLADHRAALKKAAAAHRAAFEQLDTGLACGDAVAVAQAATLSARTHQAILPSALVDAALASYAALGALGVCRAHSGTLVGLVCRPDAADETARRARAAFTGAAVRVHRCLGSRTEDDRIPVS
jgi:L-threonine kinase